jgi:tetratricopeptide (TPR) repeat protein
MVTNVLGNLCLAFLFGFLISCQSETRKNLQTTNAIKQNLQPCFMPQSAQPLAWLPVSLHAKPYSMKNAQEVFVAESENAAGNLVLQLWQKNALGQCTLLQDLSIGESWFFIEQGKAFFENEKLVLISTYPFSEEKSKLVYQYTANQWQLLAVDNDNQAIIAYQKGKKALKQGNIQEAINFFEQIQYPETIMDTKAVGIQTLVKAHEVAVKLYRQKQAQKATAVIQQALSFYGINEIQTIDSQEEYEENYGKYLALSQYAKLMGDFGLFLLRNEQPQESLQVNKQLVKLVPTITPIYLQVADAYWVTAQIDSAKSSYELYSRQMKRAGKAFQVPTRVEKRIGK